MAGHRILLPYNFTRQDEKALDFVVRSFTQFEDTEITLFNAYTPVPEIKLRESPVMEKVQSNLNYLTRILFEQEEALNEVKDRLAAGGVPEQQVYCVFKPRKKDIASEVIDFSMNNDFDIIILNRKSGRVTRFFTGSVFNKVITALKDITVCIVM